MKRHRQVEARIVRIGERVARLREKAGLSLRDLAERPGVSFATIQKIEANAIVPSVATLLKVAQGLGRRVSFFLEEPDEEGRAIVLTRKVDRELTRVPASKLTIEDVGRSLRNPLLQGTLLTIEAGGESGEEPLQHPGEEIKFFLEGRMGYRVAGTLYRVGAGDCLHFKSDVPHRWRNPGPDEAVVFSVCTPPPFFTNTYLSRAASAPRDGWAGAPRKGRT